MGMGQGYRDEWLFAHLYAARALRALTRNDEAMRLAIVGEALAPGWCEFTMLRAHVLYDLGRYADAIEAARTCLDANIPPTGLWREPWEYRDGPARLISHCQQRLGNYGQALAWAELASEKILHSDPGLTDIINGLRAGLLNSDIKTVTVRPKIALHRPGAIGDILMTLNLVPKLREAYPGYDIHYFCATSIGEELRPLMYAAGIDVIMDAAQVDPWRKSYARVFDLIGYPLAEGYPDKPMAKHLLVYFATELGVDAHMPQLEAPLPARPSWCPAGDYATIQYQAGWSKYKQWPKERWGELVMSLPDIEFVWIDAERGAPLRESIAAIANARMHLGIDSFGNHLTHYLWTYPGGARKVPGVIIWGSTQESAAGYAHNVNISTVLDCRPCFREDPVISRQPRGPCINPPRSSYEDDTPPACTARISVDTVARAARIVWERSKSPGCYPDTSQGIPASPSSF